MNTPVCCKTICSNSFAKFEPQQFPPYYDKDPNSRIKKKIKPPESDTPAPRHSLPKTVLKYEKYDLRKI